MYPGCFIIVISMASQNDSQNRKNVSAIVFILWVLQGLFFLWQFGTLPSDTDTGILFGFSPFRLAGIVFLLAWIILSAFLAYSSRQKPSFNEKLNSIFTSKTGDIYLVASLLIALVSQGILAVLWGLSQHGKVFSYAAYAVRLSPLLNLATLTSLELIAWIIVSRWQSYRSTMEAGKALLKKAIIVCVIVV